MKTKTANCPNCSPESIFDAKVNLEDNKPVWECRCCGQKVSRRVLNTKSKQRRAAKKVGYSELMDELLAGNLGG